MSTYISLFETRVSHMYTCLPYGLNFYFWNDIDEDLVSLALLRFRVVVNNSNINLTGFVNHLNIVLHTRAMVFQIVYQASSKIHKPTGSIWMVLNKLVLWIWSKVEPAFLNQHSSTSIPQPAFLSQHPSFYHHPSDLHSHDTPGTVFATYLQLLKEERGSELTLLTMSPLLFGLLDTEGHKQFPGDLDVKTLETTTFVHFQKAVADHFQCPIDTACAIWDLQHQKQGSTETAAEFLATLPLSYNTAGSRKELSSGDTGRGGNWMDITPCATPSPHCVWILRA